LILFEWCQDTQHNDTKYIGMQHNDTQHSRLNGDT
jgi:hypothetical protein